MVGDNVVFFVTVTPWCSNNQHSQARKMATGQGTKQFHADTDHRRTNQAYTHKFTIMLTTDTDPYFCTYNCVNLFTNRPYSRVAFLAFKQHAERSF